MTVRRPFDAAAAEPFRFVDYEGLVLATGRRAASLREMAAAIRRVPADVIHHHMVRTPLEHRFGASDYPNDLARWSARSLHDPVLAEKLAALDPYAHEGIETLREEIVSVLDAHLDAQPTSPRVRPGLEFHFVRGHFTALPGDRVATTLAEMTDALRVIPLSSLFYHFEESRLSRPGVVGDDFSLWIEAQFGVEPLVRRLRSIDFPFYSLGDLRARIVAAFLEPREAAVP